MCGRGAEVTILITIGQEQTTVQGTSAEHLFGCGWRFEEYSGHCILVFRYWCPRWEASQDNRYGML